MTKSQNTKKDLCITSEQLTEQWKKGELPEGWYWVKIKTWCEYIDMLYYTSDIFLDGDVPVDNDEITEVLAQVPSYEEWVGVKQQRDLENKLRHDSDNKNWQLRTENAQLKELLKESKVYIENFIEGSTLINEHHISYILLQRIKEALQ